MTMTTMRCSDLHLTRSPKSDEIAEPELTWSSLLKFTFLQISEFTDLISFISLYLSHPLELLCLPCANCSINQKGKNCFVSVLLQQETRICVLMGFRAWLVTHLISQFSTVISPFSCCSFWTIETKTLQALGKVRLRMLTCDSCELFKINQISYIVCLCV